MTIVKWHLILLRMTVDYLWSIETKIVSTDWCVEQDLDLKELAFPSMLHEQTQFTYFYLLYIDNWKDIKWKCKYDL